MKKIIDKYSTFLKYVLSAGICIAIDLSLFTLLNYLFKEKFDVLSIALSTIIARIISSCLNYYLNRNKVFNIDEKKFDTPTFIEYVLFVITQMIISSVSVTIVYQYTFYN